VLAAMRVFVLLFNSGTENEGIHTIQMGDRHKVLMFKSEDDAARFAIMLEAQDFPPASVETIDSQEVEQFCRDADYDWEIIEEGKLAIPPEKNVAETDWQLESKTPETESQMSNADLDSIRRKLEELL
jgi:Protein of unknown function (DUF3110)